MGTEQEVLDLIFGTEDIWKDKYRIKWCGMCEAAIISCLEDNCNGSCCNGNECEKCAPDFEEFSKANTQIEDYLTDEEIAIYQKGQRLKFLIIKSLAMGDKEINWEEMSRKGILCDNDHKIFNVENKWVE